jgi:ketosteroid isomerase-like protein
VSPSLIGVMRTPEATDDRFFAALLDGNADELDEVLASDFLMVDVLSGSVVDRGSFISAVSGGVVSFTAIDVVERETRRYDGAAIVVGRTGMNGAFEETSFSLASRYTHVFVREADSRWRLVSAQGTPIAATP